MPKNNNLLKRTISVKRLIAFLIISIALSNFFRFDVFGHIEGLKFLPGWIYILVLALLEGSGVLIGALIGLMLLRRERRTIISLFGTSKMKSIWMGIVPVLILTITGVNNEFGLGSHFYGFIASIGTFTYCIMEEFGWRGYMHEELKELKAWQKYLIVGFVWYLWHLAFLTEAVLGENLFFLGMMLFGSWGIGQVADATKSIIASACFHLIIQIMMFNSLIKNGIGTNEKLLILGISITIWFLIVKRWEKENAAKETKDTSAVIVN